MTLAVTRYYWAVYLNNTFVKTRTPVITEDLNSFMRTCEFELIDQPASPPEENDLIQIRRVNLDDDTYTITFAGYVALRDTDSYPHKMVVRGVDELKKFAKYRTTNALNLTDMTEGEAWMTIADVCDVDYDPADIEDTGYVLGERADVFWKLDQPASQVIAELDRVFRMKSMTVGNNRVVRFQYDRVANAALVVNTYNKPTGNDFWKHNQTGGNSTQVQSLWKIQGITTPCGDDDECSCMVWARSTDVTPVRGKKTAAVIAETFNSDLIQDEALAREISKNLMRWWNRVQLIENVEVQSDPEVHPGSNIALLDPAYGIGFTVNTPGFVTNVDLRGEIMNLTVVCGAAGDEGTTTSGVEKVCNNLELDVDWDGDFEFPDPTLPDWNLDSFDWTLPDGFLDFPVIGGDDDEEISHLCLAVMASNNEVWFNSPENADGDDWTISGNDLTGGIESNAVAIGQNQIPIKVGYPVSYRITFNATITGDGGIELYGTDNDGVFPLHFYFGYFGAPWPGGIEFSDWGIYSGIGGTPLSFGDAPDGTPQAVTIEWDRPNREFSVTVGATNDVISTGYNGTADGIYLVAIAREAGVGGTDGTATITDMVIEITEDPSGASCDPALAINGSDWVEVDPTLQESGGNIETTSQGGGYNDAIDVDIVSDWSLTAVITPKAAVASQAFHFGISRSANPLFGQYEVLVSIAAGDVFYVQGPTDYFYLAGTPFDEGVPIHVTLNWDQSATIFSAHFEQDGRVEYGEIVDPGSPGTGPFQPFILSSGSLGDTGGVIISEFGFSQ